MTPRDEIEAEVDKLERRLIVAEALIGVLKSLGTPAADLAAVEHEVRSLRASYHWCRAELERPA